MKRIALLNCLKAGEVCAGVSCMTAFNERKASFAAYGGEELVLTAFMRCNGCGGDYLHRREYGCNKSRCKQFSGDAKSRRRGACHRNGASLEFLSVADSVPKIRREFQGRTAQRKRRFKHGRFCQNAHKKGEAYSGDALLQRIGYGESDSENNAHGTRNRLEAGTPNISGIVGLASAIDYLSELGIREIAEYEAGLLAYAEERLHKLPAVKIFGNPKRRAGVISFTIDGVHGYDAAALLDRHGIAVRSGSHCAMPLLARFGLDSVLRVSPAFYNTTGEIDGLIDGIMTISSLLRKD